MHDDKVKHGGGSIMFTRVYIHKNVILVYLVCYFRGLSEGFVLVNLQLILHHHRLDRMHAEELDLYK